MKVTSGPITRAVAFVMLIGLVESVPIAVVIVVAAWASRRLAAELAGTATPRGGSVVNEKRVTNRVTNRGYSHATERNSAHLIVPEATE